MPYYFFLNYFLIILKVLNYFKIINNFKNKVDKL